MSPIDRLRRSVRERGVLQTLRLIKKFVYNKKGYEIYTKTTKPFFSEYDFYGSYRFRCINTNVCIDYDVGFLYNRVQKSANTYTCMLLYLIKNNIENMSYTSEMKAHWLRPDDLNAKQVNALEDLCKFTFVRSPYTRVLSAYNDKIENQLGKNNNNYIIKSDSFGEFLDTLAEGNLYLNKHWVPQTELLAFPPQKFDYIGKVENYRKDFLRISEYFDLQQSIDVSDTLDKNSGRDNHRTGSDQQLREYYDDEKIDKVNRLYKSDFDAFNYTMLDSVSQLT
jgi:hypothetical protein